MKLGKLVQQFFRRLDYKLHRASLSLKGGGFSNSNEEQILARYIAELLPPSHDRTIVDIGAGDGMRWSNTYALFANGWKGIAIEVDAREFVKLAEDYKLYQSVYACRNRARPEIFVPLILLYDIRSERH